MVRVAALAVIAIVVDVTALMQLQSLQDHRTDAGYNASLTHVIVTTKLAEQAHVGESSIPSSRPIGPKPNSVTITHWVSRLGNNLMQLHNAILYAERIAATELLLPLGGPIREFFTELPTRIPIYPLEKKNFYHCHFPLEASNHSMGTFYHLGGGNPDVNPIFGDGVCKAPPIEVARVLRKYAKPYMGLAARIACEIEAQHGFQGLTIHLRAGDTLQDHTVDGVPWGLLQNSYESQQPPCAMHESIINGSTHAGSEAFARVRLIAEDAQHPCIAWLHRRLPGRIELWRKGTLEQDACALMHAGAVVLSNSHFGRFFGLILNEHRPRVFVPTTITSVRKLETIPDRLRLLGPKCDGTWNVTGIVVPGMGRVRSSAMVRKAWIESVTTEQIFPLHNMCYCWSWAI